MRDLSEILLLRGIEVSHETVRDWKPSCCPSWARNYASDGTGSGVALVPETYLKVRGKWAYLYRAVDRDGNLIDAMLSGHRDMAAAKASFARPTTTGLRSDRVTTDGHGSYPRAIRTVLGCTVRHRTSAYRNNHLEQDHRGIKGLCGASSPIVRGRFCRINGELRDLLRCRRRHNQPVPAATRRSRFTAATIALGIMQAP